MGGKLRFSKVLNIPIDHANGDVYFYRDADDRLVVGVTNNTGDVVYSTHTSTSIATRTNTTISGLVGKPNGICGLDQDSKVSVDNLPEEFSKPSTALTGPKTISVNTTNTYKISGYSTFDTYTLSASQGTISRTTDTITYIAPSTPGNYTITLNNIPYVIDVVATGTYISTPSIVTPTPGTTNLPDVVNFTSSVFTVNGGSGTHLSSDWQVAIDSSFTNLVSNISNSTTYKTSYPIDHLAADTIYYVRVRYRTSSLVSNWSQYIHIVTRKYFLPQVEETKLVPPNPQPYGQYGFSIATDTVSRRVAIGMPSITKNGLTNAGTVYIYRRSGNTWTLESELRPDTVIENEMFGFSVAMDEQANRIVVGAPGLPGNTNFPGEVHVYLRTNNTYTRESTFVMDNSANGDRFGRSIATDYTCTRVVIGCKDAVCVYRREGLLWYEEIYDSQPSTGYGKVVAIDSSGTRAVVGAPLWNVTAGNQEGAALLFVRSNNTWSLEQLIASSTPATGERFGYNISIDSQGLSIAVGAPEAVVTGSKKGCTYLLTRSGTTWSHHTKLIASNGNTDDRYGDVVSLDPTGTKLVISSMYSTVNSIAEAGRLYVYILDDDDTWIEVAKLTPTDVFTSDLFSYEALISHTRIIVTSLLCDIAGNVDAGAVYVYS